MDSIRMVRIEDRLRLMIKLILGLLLKLILLLIWGALFGGFIHYCTIDMY